MKKDGALSTGKEEMKEKEAKGGEKPGFVQQGGRVRVIVWDK